MLQPLHRRVILLSALLTALLAAWGSAAFAVPTVRILKIEAASDSDWTPPTHFGLGPSTPGATDDIHYINKADCKQVIAAKNPRIKVSWTWSPSLVLGSTYTGITKVAPRGKSCTETALQETDTSTACIVGAEVTYQIGKTYTFEVDVRDLVGAETTCDEKVEQDAFLYMLVNDQASVGVNQAVVAFKSRVTIDLAGPVAPTISSVTPGGENLRVVWSHADETLVSGSYVYWAELPFDSSQVTSGAVKVSKSELLTSTSHQITGLTNGKLYYVGVVSVDDHDNESDYSKLFSGTPIEVLDGWQYYKGEGGADEGGFAPCSAGRTPASAGWLVALLAVGLLLAVRRRRAGQASALLIAGLAAAVVVLPQRAEAASPLTSSLDVRVTRYLPAVDSSFSGKAKPYADVFGDAAWQFGMSYDSRLWDRFGTLSAGFGFNYWSKEGKGVVKATGEASGDSTTFQVVPLSLDLVYRFDVMAERWNIPFVPYAKLGLMYNVWWMRNGVEEIASTTTSDGTKQEALGATGGWHGTLGLRFMLDVLEPQSQRSFDIEMGVNHSYLFAEYQKMTADDFGSGKSLNLSDDLFVFGLAFDL